MSVQMKTVSTIEMDLGLEPYGEAHNYFAECCRDRMRKYTPNSTGDNERASQLNSPTIDEECSIVYNKSYAGYQYYGQRKDGSRKVKNYTTPGTGPYWDQNMISIERQDLLQDMKDYFKER